MLNVERSFSFIALPPFRQKVSSTVIDCSSCFETILMFSFDSVSVARTVTNV